MQIIFDSFRFFRSTTISKLRLDLKNQKMKIDLCIIFHPDSEKIQVFTGGVPTHTKSKWYTFQYYLGVFFITILTFFIDKITVLSVFHSHFVPDLHLFHR